MSYDLNDEQALDRLRRALAARADTVDVQARALDEIRDRISRRRRWWPGFRSPGGIMISISTLAAGAATASLVAVTGLVSCQPTTPPDPGTSVTPSVSTPASTEASPSGSVTVPVYYAARGTTHGLPYRLYREFHQLRVGSDTPADRTSAAVAHMLTGGSAADPDYEGLWPHGTNVVAVSATATVVTVDLNGAGQFDRDRALALLAVQQLVWTATAASGLEQVRILLNGQPAERLWGAVDTSGPLRRGSGLDFLAPVWLIEPQHGATVGRGFTVHVSGYAHEANVSLRVRSEAGAVVHQGFVTLDNGAPAYGQAKTTLTLPAGRYVVEAYLLSMDDGSVQSRDDHLITVT